LKPAHPERWLLAKKTINIVTWELRFDRRNGRYKKTFHHDLFAALTNAFSGLADGTFIVFSREIPMHAEITIPASVNQAFNQLPTTKKIASVFPEVRCGSALT